MRAESSLFARWQFEKDPRAREALVRRWMPLANRLARRYQRDGEPIDDLIQVASLGLLKAIDRFDPTRGTAFTTFAVPTIAGELKRYYRDHKWSIAVPRELRDLSTRLPAAEAALEMALSRAPTASELADELGVSVERLLETRVAVAAQRTASLEPADDDEAVAPRRELGVDEAGFSGAEARATVEALSTSLNERTREILRLRFEDDLTQAEIGAIVGLSQMHVSHLLRDALRQMAEQSEQRRPAARDS